MSKFRLHRLILLLISFLLLATPHALAEPGPASSSAPQGLGVRLTEIPADAAKDPRAQSYIVDNLSAGTTITRKIAVSNRTGATQDVKVYAAAAAVTDKGFEFTDSKPNELTKWTTVHADHLSLPDGTEDEVTATIAVPKTAPDGEQYEVIWAEITGGDPSGTGVKLVNRVGIRVYLSIGDGSKKSDFTINKMTPRKNAKGNHEVAVAVTNNGARALDLSGELSLTDGPAGLSLPPRAGGGVTLGVGKSADYIFDMGTALPTGPWKANVTLKSGLLTKSQSATISFPESGTGQSVGFSEGHALWIWLAAILIALIVAIAGYLYWRRKQNQK